MLSLFSSGPCPSSDHPGLNRGKGTAGSWRLYAFNSGVDCMKTLETHVVGLRQQGCNSPGKVQDQSVAWGVDDHGLRPVCGLKSNSRWDCGAWAGDTVCRPLKRHIDR